MLVYTIKVDFIQTEVGRARLDGTYKYEYDLKDHLGNSRVTVIPDPGDASQQTVKAVQVNSYYAFGMDMPNQNNILNVKNEHLYNGKELQEELGQYDYSARFYDPVIARWSTPDPLTEVSRRWSLYTYAENNPIRNIDPDGMETTLYGDAAIAAAAQLKKQLAKSGRKDDEDGKKKKEQERKEAEERRLAHEARKRERDFIKNMQRLANMVLIFQAHWGIITGAPEGESGSSYESTTDEVEDTAPVAAEAETEATSTKEVAENLVVHAGKQGKHRVGHNNYIEGKSILTGNAQELLDNLAAGNVKSVQKIDAVKTRVDFGQ